MRSAFRKGGLAVAVVAGLFLAVLFAWRGGALSKQSTAGSTKATSSQTAVKQAGGTMADTSVRRLGTVEIGAIKESELEEEKIYPAPIVLWAGDQPAAVLIARGARNETLGFASQSYERVEGHGGPFPVTNRFVYHLWDRDPDVYSERTYTADIDGNGKDELVLLREHGGVEVYGLEKALFKLGIQKSFHPRSVHRARAGGKDVLYLLFEFGGDEKSAPPERSAVLRVDARGITRLPLGEAVLRQGEVLAVGAVNRPGSQAIDELLVLSSRKDDHVYLSRHQPDGAPLDTPRKVYAPVSTASTFEFAFVPQSRRAVAVHGVGKRIYFIETEKPVNWIRLADLKDLEPQFLEIVEGGSDPKAIVLGDKALYAVNQEGTFFTWNGGFVPSKKVEPFLRISSAGPDFEPAPHVLVQQNGGEEILVVHSRKHQLREPPFEEVLKAAERFLDPEFVARKKRDLEPTLTEKDPVRDRLIERERKAKGVDRQPSTVEEWKQMLPDSYAALKADAKRDFVRSVLGEATDILDPELASAYTDHFRHPDELKAWLAQLAAPAETTFDLYRRGAKIGSFKAPGFLNRATSAGIEFRARGMTATVVLALEPKGESAGERAQFFLVHWSGGR